MIYPDFAFERNTQIVLFFINCATKALTYYWGANIIFKIYQKSVSIRRKLLFSILSAMFLNIFVVYGISYLNGILNQKEQLFIGELYNFFRIMLPFSYLVLYLFGIHILKLPNFKSIRIMRLSYVYYICCNLATSITTSLFFPFVPEPRGWNYLRDIYSLLGGTVVIYVFYRLVCYSVKKYRLYIDFSYNIFIKRIRYELAKNFGICLIVYIAVVSCYYTPNLDSIHLILMFFICLGYIIISILVDFNNINKDKLGNKDEHITALNQSIEEFRGLKHDFNNILLTYSGFLAIEDYKKLKTYHQKMINTTVFTGTNLDLSQRISENPSFFSLIMNKLDKAKREDISSQVALICNMEEIFIDELDFNRIMAILLDNAIEAAIQTPTKRISLASQNKPDGCKLFILSNDVAYDINIENLFRLGFTTKPEHSGQGLSIVRAILLQYGNAIFNVTCYKGIFTAYLELKPF